MRRTKEAAEITRQHLLKAGLKVFGEKGYVASRLSDVAAEAGVTRGAIYWHFKNKKELFIALFKENIDPFFDVMGRALEEELSPIKKMRNVMTKILERIETNAEFRANQVLELSNRIIQRQIPELREYMKSRSDKVKIIFEKIIIAGQERGEIRKDIEPQAIISILATLFGGYGFMVTDETMLSPFQMDLSEQMVEIFIRGIEA
jgi:TetR/AcrR family acrAB operon transcriptional repressor